VIIEKVDELNQNGLIFIGGRTQGPYFRNGPQAQRQPLSKVHKAYYSCVKATGWPSTHSDGFTNFDGSSLEGEDKATAAAERESLGLLLITLCVLYFVSKLVHQFMVIDSYSNCCSRPYPQDHTSTESQPWNFQINYGQGQNKPQTNSKKLW